VQLNSTETVSPEVSVELLLQPEDLAAALRRDVCEGLSASPKWLPPKWFYDDRGSQLFESITRLAEYYPTRCEREILTRYAAEMADACPASTLVELGSGVSDKTTLLLDALATRGTLHRFVPFDVSEGTLRFAAARLARRYRGLEVAAVVGDFERHLDAIACPGHRRRLVAFLGGTVGNFDPDQRATFLNRVAAGMRPGDGLLLGTDLVKDVGRLEAAYDDASGVTAAFNLNVLEVVNRQLGADFDVRHFRHLSRWDSEHEWVEMRLRSTIDQRVFVPALDLDLRFLEGEEIRTEISAKFRRQGVEAELAEAGLELRRWWTDSGGDFALSLSFRS
jgi:L-histidine N-alpha-methyltransferase